MEYSLTAGGNESGDRPLVEFVYSLEIPARVLSMIKQYGESKCLHSTLPAHGLLDDIETGIGYHLYDMPILTTAYSDASVRHLRRTAGARECSQSSSECRS